MGMESDSEARASNLDGPAEGLEARVDAAVLAAGVATVARAASKRSSVAVLRGLHVRTVENGLELACSDMETSIMATVPADVTRSGSLVVAEAAAFGRLCKGLGGPLELSAGSLRVACDAAVYAFPTLVEEDFPILPICGTPEVTTSSGGFVETVGAALPFASKDESRPVLTGVACTADPTAGTLQAVATDSYRLVHERRSADVEGFRAVAFTVPARSLGEVVRLAKAKGAPARVAVSSSETIGSSPTGAPLHYAFTVGAVTVTCRRVEGQYPSWEQLRPEGVTCRVAFNAGAFEAVAKRMEQLPGASKLPVRLAVGPDSVVASLTSHDGFEASETVPAVVELGDPLELGGAVGVNAGFMVDMMRWAGGTARLSIISPLRPVTVTNGRPDCWAIQMPIRLS